MLTLFKIMTFEDWTDIQYETMEVYPMSWMYYMSFLFLTAFAFLNMVIGMLWKKNIELAELQKIEQLAPGKGLTSFYTKVYRVETISL